MGLRFNFNFVLAAVVSLFLAVPTRPVERCEGLDLWYEHYNDRYFNRKLPANTVILREPSVKGQPEYVASTYHVGDHYVISFSTNYKLGPILEHSVLKHEMCHIETWISKQPHGKEWRTCMYKLGLQGSFEEDIIDAYQDSE
jgi:hypothetical protein